MPSPGSYPKVKRFIDLVVALVLAVPALAVVAVAVVVGLVLQGPPVLFIQERIGRHAKPFRLVKLRTMSGPAGNDRAWREVSRVTPWGRVVRRLKVDELPQIIHLLTGQMTLIGPRPLHARHVTDADGGGRRHEVRPGFTCFAQLELIEYGYLDRYRQVSLDEEYVQRMGPRTDLAILARTMRVLLGRNSNPRPLAMFEPERCGVVVTHDEGLVTDPPLRCAGFPGDSAGSPSKPAARCGSTPADPVSW
jgi:lipopolysaccharide/colanic/teichoic acid biosynthesis glycosyltransferase